MEQRLCVLYKTFIMLLLLVIAQEVNAQETRVLTRNEPQNTNADASIEIKWYSQDFPFYLEGCNIYRRQVGTTSWEKLNTEPVAQIVDFDTLAYYQQDRDIGFYTEIMKQITPAQLEDASFLFVDILVKSFESLPFSQFLGIYYKDGEVVYGRNYEYRIMRLENGRELFLGQSDPIRAGDYAPIAPVTGFTVEQVDTTFVVDWEVAPDLYYATNIYQENRDNEIRINENPLLVTERTDSAGNVGYPSPKYIIRDLIEGETYSYSITGKDFFGSESQRAERITLEYKDVTPPPSPYDFDGKVDSMKVELNWTVDKVEDFKEVRIYRSTYSEGPYEVIHSSPDDQYYVDFIEIPGPYYYYVSSVDMDDNEGESRKMFMEVQDVFPPQAPQNLTIEIDTGKISLKWDANTDPDLKGYLVYRTAESNRKKNYVLLNSDATKETYLEQPLPEQVKSEFFYYVVAIDTMHNRSPSSNWVSGKMPDIIAPERPHIKSVRVLDERIEIEWVPNVDNDLAGYHVYRADTSGIPVKINSEIVDEIPRFTDRSFPEDLDLQYFITAIDSTGNESEFSLPFSAANKKKGSDETASFVVKVQKNKRSNRITLKWELKNPELIGFVIFKGPDVSSLKPMTGLINESSYRIDLEEDDLSQFQVRAYIKGGGKIRSQIISSED